MFFAETPCKAAYHQHGVGDHFICASWEEGRQIGRRVIDSLAEEADALGVKGRWITGQEIAVDGGTSRR